MRSKHIFILGSAAGKEQAGQSLVFIALLMVAMVGMLGLALDGSNVFSTRRQSQNAADAAAFAGARIIAQSRATATQLDVWNAVYDLAQTNGVATASDVVAIFIDKDSQYAGTIDPVSSGSIPALATGVRVTTTLQLKPYFIDVLIGQQQVPVVAVAAVQTGKPRVAGNLMPLAVGCGPFSIPPCSYLKDQVVQIFGVPQGTGGSSMMWLDFGVSGCSVSDMLNLKPGCSSGPVMADVGDEYMDPNNPPSPSPWVGTQTGLSFNNPRMDALDCWINPTSHTNCWQYAQDPGNNNWIVPLFDAKANTSGGNLVYHTFVFGEFEFLGYWTQGGKCNFVGMSGDPCKDPNDPGMIANGLDDCLNIPPNGKDCITGRFKDTVLNLQMIPGSCNTTGVDFCGIGMSQ